MMCVSATYSTAMPLPGVLGAGIQAHFLVQTLQ